MFRALCVFPFPQSIKSDVNQVKQGWTCVCFIHTVRKPSPMSSFQSIMFYVLRPKTHWRDGVFRLAWEHLRIPSVELAEDSRKREVWGSFLRLGLSPTEEDTGWLRELGPYQDKEKTRTRGRPGPGDEQNQRKTRASRGPGHWSQRQQHVQHFVMLNDAMIFRCSSNTTIETLSIFLILF